MKEERLVNRKGCKSSSPTGKYQACRSAFWTVRDELLFPVQTPFVQKYPSTNLLGKLAEFALLRQKNIRTHRCTYAECVLEGDTPEHTVVLYVVCESSSTSHPEDRYIQLSSLYSFIFIFYCFSLTSTNYPLPRDLLP